MKPKLYFLSGLIACLFTTQVMASEHMGWITNKHRAPITIYYTRCADTLDLGFSCNAMEKLTVSPNNTFELGLHDYGEVIYIWGAESGRVKIDFAREAMLDGVNDNLISDCLLSNGRVIELNGSSSATFLTCQILFSGKEIIS